MDKILRSVMKYNLVDKAKFMADVGKFTSKIVQPMSVFISCMDSRVFPSKFVGSEIGETFYIRNAGNMVPHYEDYMAGFISTEGGGLELGCIVNNIKNVVVCGHSDCRALYALFDMHSDCDHKHYHQTSPLKTWVALNGRRTADKFHELFPEEYHKDPTVPVVLNVNLGQGQIKALIDPDNNFCIQDKLSQINCLEQASHVTTYPYLQTLIRSGDLQIHAMWFDVFTGDVYVFSPSQRRFVIVGDNSVTSLLTEYGIVGCSGQSKGPAPLLGCVELWNNDHLPHNSFHTVCRLGFCFYTHSYKKTFDLPELKPTFDQREVNDSNALPLEIVEAGSIMHLRIN